MNRLGLLLCVLLSVAARDSAAQEAKPQYSASDIVNSFAAPAAPGTDVCAAQGMIVGDDGVCEPAKDARGFSLPTRANSRPSSSPAGAMAPGPAPRQMASIGRPLAVAAHRDLLITFKVGSSELTTQAKLNAQVFAQALNTPALSAMNFEIDGHTDASGAADKNRALSQQRAEAVKAFLISQGVAASRLEAKGFGADQLAAPSQPFSPENRRVEARRTP